MECSFRFQEGVVPVKYEPVRSHAPHLREIKAVTATAESARSTAAYAIQSLSASKLAYGADVDQLRLEGNEQKDWTACGGDNRNGKVEDVPIERHGIHVRLSATAAQVLEARN